MRDLRSTVLAALAAAGLAVPAAAQVGSGGTITDGDAVFTQSDSPTDPNDADGACCTAALRMAGSTGQDQAFQAGWWYRVNGRDTRELSFANATSFTWAGNVGTLTYVDPAFNTTMTWTVTDPGGTAAQVSAAVVLTNTSGADLSIDVFHYLDFDLNGSIGTDSAALAGPNDISISDGPVSGFFRAPSADSWQVGVFPGVRNLLTDADIDTLSNAGAPFGPGDFTAAYGWTETIPAGGSVTLSAVFGASVLPQGRCELASSCTTTTQPACTAAGGVWTEGTGLPCVTGRCCVGTNCSVLTQSGCTAAGGAWTQGETCPAPGYNQSGTAGAFEDISGTGTTSTASTCDDCGQANVAIGFDFNFYGTTYSTLGLASNGYFHFGTQSIADLSNDPIPSATDPDNIIAGFWDDLNPNASGSGDIFYQTLGDAPNRRFIAQWNNVYRFGTTLPCTFQIVIFETSNNIEFRYSNLPALGGTITPSIGAEDSTGAVGVGIDPATVYPTPSGVRLTFTAAPENPCANTCTADFNNSGSVTVQDIYDFLTDWNSQVSGGPVIIASADFNGAGGVTVQDLYDFFSAWNTQIAEPSCN